MLSQAQGVQMINYLTEGHIDTSTVFSSLAVFSSLVMYMWEISLLSNK